MGALCPSPRQTGVKIVPSERITFGRNFRKARKAAKLSQRDITAIAGFAQSFISEVETGKSPISIDNMAELARVVGVPLWNLLKPDSD